MWKFSPEAEGKSYLAGQWQKAANAATFPVFDPATDQKIGDVPDMGIPETNAAIAAANAALPAWSALTGEERAKMLNQWAQLIRDNAEDLGELMTKEEGKPFLESVGEIFTSADYIDWFAEEARKIQTDVIEAVSQDVTIHIHKDPVGVVTAITPWNFPAAMVIRKLAPALAAGCTTILKPAAETPLIALALTALAVEAKIPPGVLNVVTGGRGSAAVIGKTLMDSPDVQKLSFTGSTEVGKILIGQSANTVKRMSLELGGNAPLIVLSSADMDKAVRAVMSGKFMNSGQMCVSPNRIYVHESLYDAFAQKLADAVKNMVVGPGDDPDTQMGPLINQAAVSKVQSHVDDAVSKGAKILCGGKLTAAGKQFYAPTVLRDMTSDMLIKSDETFGPIAALFKFSTEAEVIAEANDTRYGLAAYVLGEDAAQCARVANALKAGMVCINEPVIVDPAIPFGGVKESGIGRENSHHGIAEYQEIRSIIVKKPTL